MQSGLTKIVSCQGNGVWNPPDGSTLYKQEITLENGVVGQCYSQAPEPWFKAAGTEVVYEITGDSAYGKKLRIKRPSVGGPMPTQGSGSDKRGESIKVQWAIKAAIAATDTISVESDFEYLKTYSQQIGQLARLLMAEHEMTLNPEHG